MRIVLASITLALSASTLAIAAPSPTNSLTKILEKSCAGGACAEGYTVRFRQATYEASKQQATLVLALEAQPGIDYPILTERFQAQLTQKSFSAICKVRQLPVLEAMVEGESVQPEFLESVRSCVSALTERTERALGRTN